MTHHTKPAGLTPSEPGQPKEDLMHDPAELVTHLVEHCHHAVYVHTDDGEALTTEAVAYALEGITATAPNVTGDMLCESYMGYLDEDGEECRLLVDNATPDQIRRALVYAAGELAALKRECAEVAYRGVALTRLLKAAEKAEV